MALTGVMGADFSAFTNAVDAAEVKLRSFESGAAKVESALSRMGNSFSGQKVIQDATLMAKIFDEMGGAASFTEKELARMNATATEAVAKLEAMGQDVPEGIRRVADETKGASKETEGWSSTVKQLALSFGAMFTARAALNFVKDITEQAGALADLEAQTRINVESLQIMGSAMAEFGVSTDQLGRGLFKLSNNIANGDDGVADALLNMGLSLKEVQGLKGEELFLTIQSGLAKLDGSLRDTTAVTLYGEKLGMSMAGAAEGTETAMEAARKLNTVMSKDTVQALDSASEAIDRMKGNLSALAANAIGPVAEGFNTLVGAFNKGASSWQVNIAMGRDALAAWTGLGSGTEHLTRLLVDLNEKEATTAKVTRDAAGAHKEAAAATDDQAGATKRLREAKAGLADFQRQTDEAAAKAPMIDEFVQKRDAAAIKKAEDDARELQAQERKLAAGRGHINMIKDYVESQNQAAAAEAAFNEEQERLLKGLQQLPPAHAAAGESAESGGKQTVAAYAAVTTQIEISADAMRAWLEVQQYTNRANAILNRNSLFTTSSQLEEIANLPLPGRAAGGPVAAGEAYLVGEKGPELFIPGANGAIATGGGGGQVINNVFHLVDTESNLARRVSDVIMRQVRAGTQLATT